MEDIKRKLVESGVIGQVVDDFNPLMELTAFYRDKRISLGDEVTRAEVEHAPTELEYYTDTVDFLETFKNRELVTLVCLIPIFVDMLHTNLYVLQLKFVLFSC